MASSHSVLPADADNLLFSLAPSAERTQRTKPHLSDLSDLSVLSVASPDRSDVDRAKAVKPLSGQGFASAPAPQDERTNRTNPFRDVRFVRSRPGEGSRGGGHSGGVVYAEPLPTLLALCAWAVLERDPEDGTARLRIMPMPHGRQRTPKGDISRPLIGEVPDHRDLVRATREQFHAWTLVPGFTDRRQALREFAKVREAAAWARAEMRALEPASAAAASHPPAHPQNPPSTRRRAG